MNSMTFFLIFVPILGFILLSLNFIFAPHQPYKEKKTPFECGYHSFLSQNRIQFTISFFIFGLLFLIFDLEIVLIYPFTVSTSYNDIYGLISMLIFVLILVFGFVFELGNGALNIESKQYRDYNKDRTKNNSKQRINSLPLCSMIGPSWKKKNTNKNAADIVEEFKEDGLDDDNHREFYIEIMKK